METIGKIAMWPRNSWPYWIYAKTIFALQPYRDDCFEGSEILKNLWVGGIGSSCNKKSLKENGIDMIVSAVYGATAYHPFDFNYEKANLCDTGDENIIKDFERLLPEIRQSILNGKGVLVHCMAGRSRSVSIVAAYLIKYHHMSAEEALKLMKQKRSCINPNEGYRNQLIEYEKQIRQLEKEQELLEEDKKNR